MERIKRFIAKRWSTSDETATIVHETQTFVPEGVSDSQVAKLAQLAWEELKIPPATKPKITRQGPLCTVELLLDGTVSVQALERLIAKCDASAALSVVDVLFKTKAILVRVADKTSLLRNYHERVCSVHLPRKRPLRLLIDNMPRELGLQSGSGRFPAQWSSLTAPDAYLMTSILKYVELTKLAGSYWFHSPTHTKHHWVRLSDLKSPLHLSDLSDLFDQFPFHIIDIEVTDDGKDLLMNVRSTEAFPSLQYDKGSRFLQLEVERTAAAEEHLADRQ